MNWAPQAAPQTVEEVQEELSCPEIIKTAAERGITSIVHFTRTNGLKGILSTGVVKSRRDLPEEFRVRYVYDPNANDRSRDFIWHSYINLSVTKINMHMFNRSKDWHPEDRWVILSFDPKILGDPGVVFCTTNNAYPVVNRCRGIQGFEQMFAPQVPWGYQGSIHTRIKQGSNQPTDPQAEVLYPFELSLEYLKTLIVRDELTYEEVFGISSHFPYDPSITIKPEAFK